MNNIQENTMEYKDSDVTDKPNVELEGGNYDEGDFSPWDIKKRAGLRSKRFKIANIVDFFDFWKVVSIFFFLIIIAAIGTSVGLHKRLGNLEEKVLYLGDIENRIGQIQKKDMAFEQLKNRLDRVEASMRISMDDTVPDPNRLQEKIVEQRALEAVSSSPEKGDKQLSKNRYHTVQQGETLYNISRIHGLTVEEIMVINRLSDSAVIYPGQKILVRP